MRLKVNFWGGLASLLVLGASAGCPAPHPTGDGGDGSTDAADGSSLPDSNPDGGSCPAIAFQSPNGSRPLGPSDDLDGRCDNGFATDVTIATDARSGTNLELLVNGATRSTATVSGPSVTFRSVMLDSSGAQTLAVRVAGTTTTCGSPVAVTVQCGTPTCSLIQPMQSTLNQADSVTGSGPFAIDFVVQTNIEANQMVQLSVASPGVPARTLMASSNGSMARFAAVGLTPDGMHRVSATCTNRVGVVGRSAEQTYTVDATPPTLMATQPMMGMTFPFDADVDAMTMGRQFRVCGRTDAVGQRLCGSVMGDTPTAGVGCTNVTDSTMDTCVEVTCPSGGAPFTVALNVSDAAGNQTTATIANVVCASNAPSVRIVDPVAYDSANAAATTLNAARDTDAMRPGLQYNVRVCTDATSGMAQLQAGGSPLGSAVAVAAAAMGDCPTGFGGVARFTGVSLPESTPARTQSTDAVPANPVLTAQVTAPAGMGTSPGVTLYVDSQSPSLRVGSPACPPTGPLTPDSSGNATVDFSIVSDTLPVTLTYNLMGGTPMTLTRTSYTIPATSTVTFPAVVLGPGTWTVVATATDPAGNRGSSINCSYLVGNPPGINFVSPTAGQTFNSSTDADSSMPGFQGATVVVHTTGVPAGMNVSLTVNGGTALTAPVDAAGDATFTNLSLPEGASIPLVATTPNIAGRGMGSAMITVIVDTQAPTAVGSAMSLVRSRRGGTFGFTFTQASDPATPSARAVSAYEVRTSTTGPVTTANFASATPSTVMVPVGAPGATGTFDLAGYALPTTLYVGIRARDLSGNVGPVVSFPAATVNLLTTSLNPALTNFGRAVSGGYDVNGDGIHDLVVGGTGEVRIYFGSATGLSATSYARITGGSNFGVSVASIGDFNGDGVGDIAVGDDSALGGAGAVYLFFGRNGMSRSWPATSGSLNALTDADSTITSSAPEDVAGALGFTLARLDFDGDGRQDLAIGSRFSNAGSTTRAGAVFVVRGTATAPGATQSLPSAAALVLRGDAAHLRLGATLSNGGTLLAGDRREELLVGGFSSVAAGAAVGNLWVVTGRDALPTTINLLPTDASVLQIDATGTVRGENIGTTADFDGDGLMDLFVGSGAGASARMFFGQATGGLDLANPVLLNPAGALGVGPALNGGAPTMARTLLNNARMSAPSDFATGTLSGGSGGEGLVLAFTGRARASWSALAYSSANYTFQTVRDPAAGSSIPVSVSTWLGDINGDGFQDLAGGQPQNGVSTGTGTFAGTVHILY